MFFNLIVASLSDAALSKKGTILKGWMDGWMFELFIDAQPQ